MTYEQYWYGEIRLVRDYIEADKIRQQRDNAAAWWQGVYVYNALTAALSVSEFFRAKGRKPVPYPEKPYELVKREKTEEEKERDAQAERMKVVAHFDALRRAYKG